MAVSEKNQNKIILGVGGAIALYFLSRAIAQASKDKAGDSLTTDEAASQAALLRSAFNPSGSSLLIQTDGTNNKAVFDAAKNIKNFGAVAKAYKSLYESNLSDDLTNELTAEELQKFFAIVKQSATALEIEKKFAFKMGMEVISKPKAGFTRTGYYKNPLGATGEIRPLYYNQKPGSYMGKIVARVIKRIKDENGKIIDMPFYGVNDIPLKDYKKTNVLYVREVDLAKMK